MGKDLKLHALVQRFPGYTRVTIDNEDACIVQRLLMALEEEAKEQKLQAKHAGRE